MRRYYFAPLLFAALACGCERQPEFAPVEGTVTRAGRPVANIEVAFYADEPTRGPRSTALTDANGRYRLQADTGADGAVVGAHRVCLYDRDPAFIMSLNMGTIAAFDKGRLPPELAGKLPTGAIMPGKAPVSRVPDKYMQPWESPLRVEVKSGPQTHDFQIP
ncbi:hypothetical protein GobsT_19170 [Gemmata obscuriglobus]|uniref:Carboxypeptidase regulatory-like domain-containing protein n=1 Tax=Gemmata obscuriglobus TaxID=114 RepID=A0A2Z3HDG4_9BACT|nr:carboxypeptidase-like regulatory domain-containing protein [Gemmata obscuriglobus]AWM39724.1 hypothetical protein C1280_23800 [Gemmata obscuriglobus]QEG27163.1 hypothetical protein GobsT_19170 [Gemmata obscuriglobus]VTS03787.1 Putative secreted protein OS=Rhodopirellula sp. SWK7 GN=RRSWK_05138 PE=4 SV=1 [Gemmata obscuriglobus UQM 2246]